MSQIPILSGIYADGNANLRTSYPVNLVPVPKDSGAGQDYLRPADGMVSDGTGPGITRGAITWNGACYRVMGTRLVRIEEDSSVVDLGRISGTDLATFGYSFDQLGIAADGKLHYWNGRNLSQVTDPDLGRVVDLVWVDGYFMVTDGRYLVVTDLDNASSVNPLKYGSAEADPDPVVALLKFRNEVYALNRYTIEVFNNVGGLYFPFQRVEGAQVQKGCVGTRACCVYTTAIAFLGSGRNEPPGVFLAVNSQASKISTDEIDTLLQEYSEAELATAVMENRVNKACNQLLVHLPDRTLVFDAVVSQALGRNVWYVLTSTLDGFSQYRARDLVWCYGQWLVGDPQSASFGHLTDTVSSHWGDCVRWEFGTSIAYNGGRAGIIHELELMALPGSYVLGDSPTISTSYSLDGLTWSLDRAISAGVCGQRGKRLAWRRQGILRNWRIQRFQGDSSAHISFLRLEAQIEPLAV